MTVSQSHLIDLTSLSCYYMWMITYTDWKRTDISLCRNTLLQSMYYFTEYKPGIFCSSCNDLFIHKLKETTSGFHISMNKRSNVNHFFKSENSEIPFSVLMTSSKNISWNKLKIWKLQCPFSFLYSNAMQISWLCTGRVIDKIYAK